jgi:predicted ATPase
MEQTGERWFEPEMWRSRGQFLLRTQRPDIAGAEASFREALLCAQRQQTRSFELRAATDLARLLREQGGDAPAREILAPAYGWFSEDLDAPDLIEAKALLDALC